MEDTPKTDARRTSDAREGTPLPQLLTRWVRGGLIALVALLPFHAFAITAVSRALGLSTDDWLSPWVTALQAWKELLLVVLLVLVVWRSLLERRFPFRVLAIDLFVVGLLLLALLHLPLRTGWYTSWVLGLRTDLEFLLPWYLARSVPWNVKDLRTLLRTVAISAVAVLLLGVAHGLLPERLLTQLGYSPYVSSWVPGKPLPLFHALGDGTIRRWMSTFAGPNQYAAELLLLLGIALGVLLARRAAGVRDAGRSLGFPAWLVLAGVLPSLLLAGSRGAMLGALVVAGALCLTALQTLRARVLAVATLILVACSGIGVYAALAPASFNAQVVRLGSSDDHVTKFLKGVQVIADHPAGLGLGQAGPVSARLQRVEIGGSGGLVSESWYLQVGEELGVAGLALIVAYYLALLLLCINLGRAARDLEVRALAWGTALGALGLFTQATFLHTFADNAPVTLTLWVLFGIIAERTATFVAPTSTLKSKAFHALQAGRTSAADDARS